MNSLKKNPPITVLMPAYNAEAFIEKSINSILNQSFKDFIFLIIDDASQDSTVEIISRIQKNDPRIQLLKNEQNLGVAGTLNIGLQHIKTPFLARMDSDDISVPERLEKQYKFLEANPQIDICGSYIDFFGSKNGTWEVPLSNEDIKASLLWDNNLAHPTIFLRTEIFIKNNKIYSDIFKNPSLEDYHLWMELLPFATFANISEVLVSKRVHNESVTQQHEENELHVLHNFFKYIFNKYRLTASEEEISLHLLHKKNSHTELSGEILRKFKAWQEKLKAHFSQYDYLEKDAIEKINLKKWKNLLDKIQLYNLPLLIDYLKLSENKPAMLKLFLKKKVKKILSL